MEFQILYRLAEAPRKVFAVGDFEFVQMSQRSRPSVETHISNIRQKLGKDVIIGTASKGFWLFTEEVTELAPPAFVIDNLTPASHVFAVPYPKPSLVVGREKLLLQIKDELSSPAGSHLVLLHGLDGVGKTDLAAKYAYDHQGEYQIVGWLRAGSAALFNKDLRELIQTTKLDADRDRLSFANVLQLSCLFLRKNTRTLPC